MVKSWPAFAAAATLVCAQPCFSQTPSPQPTELPGKLTADLGGDILQTSADADGNGAFIVHGYAAYEPKSATSSDPSKVSGASGAGEFLVRLGNLCVSEASAQVVPIGVSGAPAADIIVTGVKAEPSKENCGSLVNVSYGLRLPANVKPSQIAYTVFISGKVTPKEAKPKVMPKTPM